RARGRTQRMDLGAGPGWASRVGASQRMRWWILGALVSLVAVAQALSQPRLPAVGDGAPIRVESRGNELYALRDAPVAYARLERLVVDIARPSEPGAGPIRVARVSPRPLIAWVLCVT